jgi:cation:H+ antiporter
VLFVAVYVGFTAYVVSLVREQMSATEIQEYRNQVRELAVVQRFARRALASLGLIAAGIALLGGGAHATVTGAVQLAKLLDVDDRIIGLTIVAAGTGLPEAVTSLVSSLRGHTDVAIGNVIGSNLFNILGILGLGGLITPVPVASEIRSGDNWWMVGVTLLLFPLMFTGLRIQRLEGLLLLGVYVIYLTLLLVPH